ncbi:MAG TPA: Wzz/FepE/Etk N-terminal domain-containing protein [Acidobacteriaceae bacterium]|nr:Wzz/FepE/Etk N-terminal domain-containing protein [Acidobacteriaceae bacterium]
MATETQYTNLRESASAAPPPVKPAQDEISLLDLAIVLAERKRTIAWITTLFAAVSLLLAFILPKSYTATVVILPPQQNSSMATVLAAQLTTLAPMASLAGGSLGLKNPNDMYVSMLKSRAVEDAMILDPRFELMKEYRVKLLSDARKAFENHTEVDGSGKDNLIRISVTDRDPNKAAEMANSYVKEFQSLSKNIAFTEASQRRFFFQQQLEQAKDNLADAEEALKNTQQQTGLIQLDSQARALIESAASLRAQIAVKEMQIQGMSSYAAGDNPQLTQARQELDSLQSQLAKLGGSEDTANSLIVPKGKVPEAGLEYVRKLRDVKYYETIFDILARQFEIAKLDEAKEGSLVQVVDPAIVPDHKSSPKRLLIVILGTLAGLMVGILTALAKAGLERLKTDPESDAKLALFRSALLGKRHPA